MKKRVQCQTPEFASIELRCFQDRIIRMRITMHDRRNVLCETNITVAGDINIGENPFPSIFSDIALSDLDGRHRQIFSTEIESMTFLAMSRTGTVTTVYRRYRFRRIVIGLHLCTIKELERRSPIHGNHGSCTNLKVHNGWIGKPVCLCMRVFERGDKLPWIIETTVRIVAVRSNC